MDMDSQPIFHIHSNTIENACMSKYNYAKLKSRHTLGTKRWDGVKDHCAGAICQAVGYKGSGG